MQQYQRRPITESSYVTLIHLDTRKCFEKSQHLTRFDNKENIYNLSIFEYLQALMWN